MSETTPPDRGRQPDELFHQLVETIDAVTYVLRADRPSEPPLYMSPQCERILGLSRDQLAIPPQQMIELMHPDDRDRLAQRMADSPRTGWFDEEYRVTPPGGEARWIRNTSQLVQGVGDRPSLWFGVIRDVGDRHRAEEELRRSEARSRALVEQIPAIVYEMGPDDERRTLYVSPAVEDILGYERQEWLDQPDIWTELLHPDDREIELAAHDLHNETGEPWSREYRLIASDGRAVWVRDQAVLVHDPESDRDRGTWHGVMLDITAQKRAEEDLVRANDELEMRVLSRTAELEDANEMMSLEIGERLRVEAELRRAEERFRRLVEQIPAAVYIWDVRSWPEGVEAYTAPQIETMLGYTPTEWATDEWRKRLHPHDRERVLRAADHSMRTGEPFRQEHRYLARDGRVVWVLDQATLMKRDADGTPLLFQGVLVDISAAKDAEAKAVEAESWFRRLTEESPGLTWVASDRVEDPEIRWRSVYVSPRSMEMLGFEPASFAEHGGWRSHLHPDDRERVIAESERMWRTGESWSSDFRMIAADGRVIWFHLEGRAVERDELGVPRSYQGVLVDIDARKREEERLREVERRYRELLEGMPAIPWTEVYDPETSISRYLYIGPQVRRCLGYSPQELQDEPDSITRMLHPDDREAFEARGIEADRQGEWEDVYRIICRDGVARWFHGIGRRVSVPGESPHMWQGVTIPLGEDPVTPPEPSGLAPTVPVARAAGDASPQV
jgi:PAS domain S-box-containing protein